MINDAPKQARKSWEELLTAASRETDPEKSAYLAEELFAALEERERIMGDSRREDS